MTVILVRHGESEANAAGIVQGWLDVPLSARGRAQASATARRLAGEPVVAFYSSDLRRARETAEHIAGPHGLDVIDIPALREYGFGEAQGLTWAEVAARWPHAPEAWGVGRIPGEEGAAAFRGRVAAAFDTIAERHREDLAVVAAHGGTIVQILGYLMGLPTGGRVRAAVANCALTTVRAGRGAAMIVSFNDQCHLADPTLAG